MGFRFKRTADLDVRWIARCLVVLVAISSTKWFAMTNWFELCLWVLFLSNAALRASFVDSLRDPRVKLVMLYWFWILLASLWGEAPGWERIEDWWSWRKLILVPMAFSLFEDSRHKDQFSVAILATCTVYLIASWSIYFQLIDIGVEPQKLIENHSTQGILFSFAGLICVVLAVRKKSWVLRTVLGVMALSFVLNNLVISTGRSGYAFMLFIAALAIWFYMRNTYRLFSLALVFGCCVGLISFEKPRDRLQLALNEAVNAFDPAAENSSVGIRIVMWRNTLKMIAERPLLGTGSGSFKYYYHDTVRDDLSWRGTVVDDPHQQYLHVAAEYGLVGLLLFLVVLASWFFGINKLVNDYQLIALAVLCGTAVNGLYNGHFSAFVEGRLIWLCLAIYSSGVSSLSLPWFSRTERLK